MRTTLFFLVCIPVRLLIAALTHTALPHVHPTVRVTLALPYFAVALGFVRTTLLDHHVGCFGGYAWWARNRPYHAALWFAAAVLVVCGEYMAAAGVLYGDVAFGLLTRCVTDSP